MTMIPELLVGVTAVNGNVTLITPLLAAMPARVLQRIISLLQ